MTATVDERTLADPRSPSSHATVQRRGWLVRRMLLLADLVGLSRLSARRRTCASQRPRWIASTRTRSIVIFALSLPHGSWSRSSTASTTRTRSERITRQPTTFVGVFHMVTVCTWLFFAFALPHKVAHPKPPKLAALLGAAIAFVSIGRAIARAYCRRHINYLQNTVIVGAGDVGQLVAQKLLQHPEYGINLVGFRRRRAEGAARRPRASDFPRAARSSCQLSFACSTSSG